MLYPEKRNYSVSFLVLDSYSFGHIIMHTNCYLRFYLKNVVIIGESVEAVVETIQHIRNLQWV